MIGIGFCTKSTDQTKKAEDLEIMAMPGQENYSWGYHGDDGYSFCSGNGELYGDEDGYTTGDTIGCYLNFENKIVFYTKNGINQGIASYLPDDLDDILYPCVGFRSQGGSVEVNFGDRKFEYSVDNKDIGKRIHNLINEVTKSLETNPSNVIDLSYRGRIYFIMGRYEEALEGLNKLLKIDQYNIIALRYRGEINYIMKRYNESIADLNKLLKIEPDNAWAKEVLKLDNKL
ncbi:hypothetical protein C2G38_2194460 [Gigaspora rosea]|uniref:B30.2/SPRY domain-containing protein n=1 Tax=Gigaspora rosea TaxID=44941 RepID=A0A397UZ62_9GLOM|nr:hypothetical protein C2G38_2194460 [Gigaspora rosea]